MNNNNIKVICSVFLALVLLIPASALMLTQTEAQPQTQSQSNSKVFVVGEDMTVHGLSLKATQTQSGKVTQVSGFTINPNSVVQLPQGQNLIVFTGASNPITIDKVKVTNERGQTTRLSLFPLQSNTYSLAGLNAGVYILNVIVDNLTDNSKGAYETVLVILAPNQQPIQPVTAIQSIIVKVKTDTNVIFRDNGNGNNNNGNKTKPTPKPDPTPDCSNEAGSANLGFPYQKITQCELEEWEDCKKIVTGDRGDRCYTLREMFSDDCDILGVTNLEECNEYYSRPVIIPDENSTDTEDNSEQIFENETENLDEIEPENQGQNQDEPLETETETETEMNSTN
jgi:hypothetical protein